MTAKQKRTLNCRKKSCVVQSYTLPHVKKAWEKSIGQKFRKVKHLDLLLKHIQIILYTAYLKNQDPISTLIYAWQERGKSAVVLSIKNLGLLIEDDCTAYGLARKLNELYEKRQLKAYHHLLIPDLEKICSRGRYVKNELRSFLQTLMFDGVQTVDTYNIHLDLPYRYKIGVVACVTPDVFNEKSSFRRLGFLSRLIPFSFDYEDSVIEEILSFIGTIQHDKVKMETIKLLKHRKIDVQISNEYFKLIKEKAKILAKTIDDFCLYAEPHIKRVIGTRAKLLLTTYVKALALLNGHSEILKEDIREFEVLFHYFNFKMEKLP